MPEQKWDYLFVVYDAGRPRYVNGQEIPDWQKGPTGLGYMEKLYWRGWELVTNRTAFGLGYSIKSFPKFSMIFRRAKKQ